MMRNPILFLLLSASLDAATSPRFDFTLGVLAESRGNVAKAAPYFEKARLADPQAFPLVQRAVRAKLASGDRAAAVKLYRDLAATRLADLSIQLTYADFLTEESRGDTLATQLAVDVLEAALKNYPKHPQIIRRLFQQAQAAGNESRQVELIGQLAADEPASVLLYTSLAKSLFDQENAETRGKLDQRFLDGFQSHPEIRELARAASDHFRDSKRPEQAIDILKRHVEAAPSSLDLRTRLGILFLEHKQDSEGEAALKSVLEIHPRQVLAHQSLAKFYRLQEKSKPARFHAGEVLKIRGGSAADFLKLADEWLAAEQPREARILLEKAIFDQPENYELASKLAIATRRDPEKREFSARLFREAESLRPIDAKTEPEFLMESAQALIEQGQSKAAEERLRSAIRAFPADAKKETAAALRRLAGLWEKENRNLEAARSLRQRADGLDR